jgi:hypothetical protein
LSKNAFDALPLTWLPLDRGIVCERLAGHGLSGGFRHT